VSGMKALRRRPVAVATTTVTSTALVGLGVIAFLDPGVPTADVELHDGAVWLTNQSTLMVGHLNHPSQLLDSALRTVTSQFDVLQDEDRVLVHDAANNVVSRVDPALVALERDIVLPRDAQIAMGGDVVAVFDPEDGRVWAMPYMWLDRFDAELMPVSAELGPYSSFAVGVDGTVHAVSGDTGETTTIRLDGDGLAHATTGSLPVSESTSVAVTAVGPHRVVLDRTAGLLVLPDGTTHEVPREAVLQQPSAANAWVAVATADALLLVPLDGGEPHSTSIGGSGIPAAPVYLNGCTYAAWAGVGVFVRDCLDDAFDVRKDIDGALPSAAFVFRVNRDLVVLNDYVNGTGWLATEGMEEVSNWDDLLPPPDEDDRDVEFEQEDEIESLPDRDQPNTPPVAENDEFGARPGRTTVLPIIDNDYDLDGDVLTAIVVDASNVSGEVQSIRGGAALQIVLPDTASGIQTFTYRANDGRGGVDDATVTVRVVAESENTPPEPRRRSRLALEAGATATYNVIPDWIDPDGDTLFLRDVMDNGVDAVSFSPDGQITVTANADVQGTREIGVIVSDGRVDVEGVLRLDVWPTGTQPPQTNSDHVVTTADRPVTVSPLGNDISRSGLALRLAKLSEVRGATVVADYLAGTFTFSSSTVGTYYVQYLVTDGPSTASSLVRIDVLPQVESSMPPIAVSDTALIAPGADVLVDVLANDSDPGGGVLVVQSVDVPRGAGLKIAVLEHRLVRVTNSGGITEPVTLTYKVSNGTLTAEAEIVVLPIDPPAQNLAPVAEDDEVVVRAGDIATVHVLGNDHHPSGLGFSLLGLVEPGVDPSFADVFVSEDALRIQAGSEPGQALATYDIVDEMGQRDSAVLKIRIVALDPEHNSAPRPGDVTARVLSGNSVRIPIPLDGIDPDGDSVELLGPDGAPALGRIVQIGQDWLVYEAYPESKGTDTFTYLVRDRLGAEASGTIIVGVAPAEFVNHPPVAVKDEVAVRPNRAVSYPVLANDSDPDSDLIFLEGALEVPEGIAASVVGDRVLVEAAAAGEYTILYTVSDVYGATATSTLHVRVDPDTPLAAPVARDDRVAAADIADDGTVTVPVLENDEDPDGVTSQLTITVDPLVATVNPDRTVTLAALDAAQVVKYTVTDPDGLTASAFILVPGTGSVPPRLKSTAPIEVVTGQTVQIRIADYIVTSNGNPPIITEAERVYAAHSNGESLVVDEQTLSYTSAEGYVGKDGLTLQVTDGLAVDDPLGRSATVTIPIDVTPGGNLPPTIRNTSVSITPGEDPARIDLARLSSDPNVEDRDRLAWEVVGSAPAGVTAQIVDGVLSIGAASSVRQGTSFELPVTVTDGKSDPIEGLIQVSVTASSRTLPVANDDRYEDARPGVPLELRPLANDLNPFPETPLTIVDTRVESGVATVAVDGEVVTITPGATFHGTVIVRYTVHDATDDPSRAAEARIVVTVAKEPDAPAKPVVKTVEDRTVVLEWVSPPSNGAPITRYTVTSDQGTVTECSSTICTITNLTNDVQYRFTVVAHNRIGASQPSPPSDVARPDVRPDQPHAPRLTFGDRSLQIEWDPAVSHGSPVRSYTLEISPSASGGAQKTNITGTSYTWTGLENGVAYQVRIQAHNDAPEPSSWSDYSASEIPAGPPAQVDKPTTTRMTPVGERAQIGVTWTIPSGNGDTVSQFTVNAIRGGSVVASKQVSGTTTSTSFELDTSSTAYTFTVVATNKAGSSTPSVPSDPRRAFVAPGTPTNVVATPGDRQLAVTFTPGALNGADAGWVQHQYALNGSSSWSALPANGVITGLSNGTSYTVRVRAVTTADGATYTGNPSTASAAQIPYGPIGNPTITSTSASNSVTFTITAPATNGRPITQIETRTKVGAGSWSSWAVESGFTSGSRTKTVSGLGGNTSVVLEVRVTAQDTANQGTASKMATTFAPTSWVSKGGSAGSSGCSNCNYLVVNWDSFIPGDYQVQCRDTYGSTSYITETKYNVTVGSSGAGSKQLTCFFGYPGEQVWISWISGPGAPYESTRLTW